MSFKLVAQVFELKVGNPLRKMVLIKLADQANDEGACWPSYESIAKGCEITRRSVITHIKWLEKNGFLWIERRYNAETQKNNSKIFHLTLAKGVVPSENDSPSKDANTSEGDALGSEGDAPSNGEGDALGSEGDAPKPINESINQPINESICGSTEWIAEKFEEFYKLYPKKKSKGQAVKTWNDVFLGKKDHKKPSDPEALFQQIITGLQAQTPSIMAQEERFRKYPSTWLNAQAWLDDVSQPSVNHQSSKPQRSTPDPLAVNAKYDVPTEMTDEQKRAWFAGGTDSAIPSDSAPDNSHDHYYG